MVLLRHEGHQSQTFQPWCVTKIDVLLLLLLLCLNCLTLTDASGFFYCPVITRAAAPAGGSAPDAGANGSEQQQPSAPSTAPGTGGSAGEGAPPAPKKTVKITAQKFNYMKVSWRSARAKRRLHWPAFS
jgi:hypothetical protein